MGARIDHLVQTIPSFSVIMSDLSQVSSSLLHQFSLTLNCLISQKIFSIPVTIKLPRPSNSNVVCPFHPQMLPDMMNYSSIFCFAQDFSICSTLCFLLGGQSRDFPCSVEISSYTAWFYMTDPGLVSKIRALSVSALLM